MAASQNGHLETVRFLVEHGGAAVNAARTDFGGTALTIASEFGHLEIVRCLVEQGGATVNLARTACGRTPLMFAAWKGHLDTVRLLLLRGADRQLLCHAGRNARTYAQDHPLVQAALA